ncbi:MAG TPA: MTAP family purine nucleoside phosphorylase [Solirubrobacterales bacterium]|nr:MTAP family purine nucleoside phosphorylase [Solirubrobacterales bacterium]
MGRLAVIGGHSIMDSGFPAGGERREIETPSGTVDVADAGAFVALQRHGLGSYTQPHAIDYEANLRALAEAGCDRVLAICSVGGLRRELGVGTMLAPDDFIALHLGLSTFDDQRGHRVPGIDPEWRRAVVEAWSAATEIPLADGGVYWQTIGPRLETAAEIRLIAAHADVVGMTFGSECVVAGELGLPYAAICVVDNLANGVAERPLRAADIRAGAEENRRRLIPALEAVLPRLVGAG